MLEGEPRMGWLSGLLGGLGKIADQSPGSAATASTKSQPPAGRSESQAATAAPHSGNPLAGKKLRYKIGADDPGKGDAGEVVEVGYDWEKPLPGCISIAYCNLFNEKFSEQSKKERA